MEIGNRLKWYLIMAGNYVMLIGVIVGLRALYGMDLQLKFYGIMTVVIMVLLTLFSFAQPHHVERLFPKGSTVALILVLTLRFLPLMRRKISNIKHTQQMRGAKFTGISQFKNYLSLFIPAILCSMTWANGLIEGLRMRGEQ